MQQRNLIPPKNDSDFEEIMKIYARLEWNKNFVLCGRRGQLQNGIDIWDLQDSDRVIQCKNYSADRVDSFLKDIKGDYSTAVQNYSNIKYFVAATTIPDDVRIQKFIANMNKENRQNFVPITVELLSWNDISDFITKHSKAFQNEGFYTNIRFPIGEEDVHTDNAKYAESFSETLFLHKEQPDSKVNLCNLFVMPKYKVNEDDTPKTDLKNKLSAFVKSDKRFLFIEGDAGCGKSTLVSWMNYHLQNNDNTAKNIFGDRPVITIRLRELTEEIEKEKSLSNAILKYMGFDNEEDLNNRFPKAVMILDGFDELCMIDGISDYNRLLYKLHQKGKADKYIITSRPKYIDNNIRIPRERITLQHFDKEKRQEWIKHYTFPNYCSQTLEQDVREYIENISKKNDSAIFDTPMTLYMLAANNKDIDIKNKNSWQLYHQIFYHELSETKYNVMFGGSGHSINECSDIIYSISEEIAYRMYQTNNNQLYVVSDELKNIVDTLTGTEGQSDYNDNTRKWVKQCYALCNYWKETGIEGAVEFYHNNIRDFFLCEKIYRELNAIYSQRDLSKDNLQPLIDFFKQFTKAPLQDMVCKFILLRAEKDVNDKNSFVYKEKNQRLLPYLFEEMLTNGELYDNLYEKKHIQAIVNILSCTAQVYRHIYEYILAEKEHMKWWNNVGNINNNSDVVKYCLRYIFTHKLMSEHERYISNKIDINWLDLYKINLTDVNFRDADLSNADLSWTNLIFANLRGANLRNANLRNVSLRNANLSSAYLSRADLRNADLSDAYLDYADLSSANLGYAYLSHADLRCAILISADLRGAYLTGADLRYADLSRANLIGATLPDGFTSDNQEEQVQHLKEMNIEGLKI